MKTADVSQTFLITWMLNNLEFFATATFSTKMNGLDEIWGWEGVGQAEVP